MLLVTRRLAEQRDTTPATAGDAEQSYFYGVCKTRHGSWLTEADYFFAFRGSSAGSK